MKTLWGSCSVGRRTVTFNLYLIKAPMDCVDYVVLHELVHFLHPDHSKAFYGCLSRFMPDHRERKARLRTGKTACQDECGGRAADGAAACGNYAWK